MFAEIIRTVLSLHTPLDPLHNDGYQFWSGIGSGSPVFVGLLIWWRRHNCHISKCWRLQWHPHPETKHPVCRKHHPHYQQAVVSNKDDK